ncbi:PHO1-like protein [Perkinsela sp. CCAP 1560/4]|nr:PHO1-like protein [Perkinsela sp. CCAP 1560/4]|eukprot:KNH05608.1 PHO1-like protein [Perkinsela sp. CCAP 1560/4]
MDQGSVASVLMAYLGRGVRCSLHLWIVLNTEFWFLNPRGILCGAADGEDALEHILQIDGDMCIVNLKSALLALPFHKSALLPEASSGIMSEQILRTYEEAAKRDTEVFCEIAIEKIMKTFIFASKRSICDHLHVPLFDLERNHTIHIKHGAYSLNGLYYWRNQCLKGFYDGSSFATGVKNSISWHVVGTQKNNSRHKETHKPNIDVHRPPRFKKVSLDYLRDNESWLRIALHGRRKLALTVGDMKDEPRDIAPYWDKRTVSKKILSGWLMVFVFGVVLCMGGGVFGGVALIAIFVFPYMSFYLRE